MRAPSRIGNAVHRFGPWLRVLVVTVGAFFGVATPAPRHVRNYPAWRVFSEPERSLGCLRARAWVSRSGKEGVGVTVRLMGAAPAAECRVALVGAALVLAGGRRIAPSALPAPVSLGEGTATHVYLPFPFDNERAWNDGEREGVLELTFAVDGAPQPAWRLSIVHEHTGYHREERYGPR